jgi:HK97 family phage portal protein
LGTLSRSLRSHAQSGVSNPQSWLVDWLGGGTSSTGLQVNETTAMQSTSVYACIKILAETIASLPIHVYEQQADGATQLATKHWSYRLLHDRPNPEMTTQEWLEVCMGHLLSWGNCYNELQFDQGGRVIALWPLRPDRMQIYRDPKTLELDYQFSLYRNGGIAHLTLGNCLHVRLLSRDGIVGMSPIGQNMETIGFDLALRKYGGKLFGNSAVPIGAITYNKPLNERQKKDLKADFDSKYRGLDNAARTALFEDGMGWQAIGLPPEQLQYIAAMKFALEDVARIYRIPPHLLQELMRSTNNNIEHQGIDFVTHTVRPYVVRYEQRFQSTVFAGDDRHYARFKVDALLRGDLASRYAAYAIGKQWGWLNSDEIRAFEEMAPTGDDGGKEYLRPLNMVPAGTPLSYLPPKGQAPPDQQDDGPEAADPQARRLAIADVLGDVVQRIARRERQDVLAAAKRYLGKGDVEGFKSWSLDFFAGHRTFIEQQLEPVAKAAQRLNVSDASPAELADRMASRGLSRVSGWIRASNSAEQMIPQLEAGYSSIEADELEASALPAA